MRERTHWEHQIREVLGAANVCFGPIADEVLGVHGRRILCALAEGEDDPRILANFAERPLRDKADLLEEAIGGFEGSRLRSTLGTQLDRLVNIESEIGRLNAKVVRYVSPLKFVGD